MNVFYFIVFCNLEIIIYKLYDYVSMVDGVEVLGDFLWVFHCFGLDDTNVIGWWVVHRESVREWVKLC